MTRKPLRTVRFDEPLVGRHSHILSSLFAVAARSGSVGEGGTPWHSRPRHLARTQRSRAACIRAGYDVVPLILPVAILLSLIAVQIRFLILVPVVLVGLACIVGVELWVFEPGSNGLFQLAAAISPVLVALTPAVVTDAILRMIARNRS